MTLNPFGTFGTGYDVGTYGQTPKMDDPPGGVSRSSGGSIGDGGSLPSTAILVTKPAAVPSFSHELKANRRVDFTNESLNAVNFLWSFGTLPNGADAGWSSHKNPIFFYPDVGGGRTYTVTLRAYNADGNYEEITSQVFVEYIKPVCDFSYVASGTIVNFTDLSVLDSESSSLWIFGDGESSTQENPYHTYSGNGIYTVKLIRGGFSKTYVVTIDAEVVLTCNTVTGATGYKWERSPDGVLDWEQFADTALPSIGVTESVHGIDSTIINFFRVRAYNGAGVSDYSDITNVRCE